MKNTNKPASALKNKIPKKKLLLLVLSTVIFFSVYQLAVSFQYNFIIHIYCISAGILAILYILINRGILDKPDINILPQSWSHEKKEAFLAEQTGRRKKSSVILYFLIPIILSVIFDMIYIFMTVNIGIDL